MHGFVELEKKSFPLAEAFLKQQPLSCDTVAAFSITKGYQAGRVFVDDVDAPGTALFWHYGGFALLAGERVEDALAEDIRKLLRGMYEPEQERFALLVGSDAWAERLSSLLSGEREIVRTARLKFALETLQKYVIPQGYVLRELDREIYGRLAGKVIPAYSWGSAMDFVKYGKGFCLMEGNEIACAAFTAFAGNGQADIGIETAPAYRGKGLALVTASAMAAYILQQGMEPVWGCVQTNDASRRTAERLGFRQAAAHPFYVRKDWQ